LIHFYKRVETVKMGRRRFLMFAASTIIFSSHALPNHKDHEHQHTPGHPHSLEDSFLPHTPQLWKEDGGRERGRGLQRLSPRDGLLNPGFLQLDAPQGAKELFIFLNAYSPDRHGMCQRITRQSNAAKAGGRRGKRDAIETIETIETSQDLNQEDVLEEDEIEIREGRNYHHHREQLDKQLASQLRIKERELAAEAAQDKRPKCQPIGQQLDCRCDYSAPLPASGWCALWGCKPAGQVQQPFEVIGHWECLSWC